MIDTYSDRFKAALEQASSEWGLADYYQPCVRPLFNMPLQQWPMCCGGNCEPCAQQLINVATRMCQLLEINADDLGA